MKSVLFFTQPRWAFAQIHHALIKRLWEHNIYAHLLDWTQNYTPDEWKYFNDKYDLFLTTPEAAHMLRNAGISYSRIASVVHCERDMAIAIHENGKEFFKELHSFGGVNRFLVDTAKQMGIEREMTVTPIGIDTKHFFCPVRDTMSVVGYAGAMEGWLSHGPEIKRGRLYTRVMEETGIQSRIHKSYHHLAMPGFYKEIDAVMVTSSYETVGLPILEASAAGRLVISTEVGYANGKQGILCRMPDEEFIADAKEALLYYYHNPRSYRRICEVNQDYTMAHHDWDNCIDAWVKLFQ